MNRKEVKNRKVRDDKKRDVKPTIPLHLYDCVADLSYVSNTPIKNIVEFLCIEGLSSHRVIEYMSKDFKRDYIFSDNIVFMGNNDLSHPRYIIRKEKNRKRVSTRFVGGFYESIINLSHSLDRTPSSTTGFLLEVSIKDISIIDNFLRLHTDNLNESRRKVLNEAIKYIRKDNPFVNTLGFMDMLRLLFEWIKK